MGWGGVGVSARKWLYCIPSGRKIDTCAADSRQSTAVVTDSTRGRRRGGEEEGGGEGQMGARGGGAEARGAEGEGATGRLLAYGVEWNEVERPTRCAADRFIRRRTGRRRGRGARAVAEGKGRGAESHLGAGGRYAPLHVARPM